MAGHGHVIPNTNGVKARCGGPALCPVCRQEQAALEGRILGTPVIPEPKQFQGGITLHAHIKSEIAPRIIAEVRRRNAERAPGQPAWTMDRLLEELIRNAFPAPVNN